MRAGNHSRSTIVAARNRRLDVEHLRSLAVDINMHVRTLQELLCLLDRLRCRIAQHLQSVLRATDDRTQCNGNRKARHTRIRNADAHSVFVDIGREQHLYPIRSARKRLARLCHTQSDRNRLRTSDCRHNLTSDKVGNLGKFFCCHIETILQDTKYTRRRWPDRPSPRPT